MSTPSRCLSPLALMAVTLIAGVAAMAPHIARADGFSFSYSNGWHSSPWYGPPPRHGHRRDAYWDRHYWGPPAYRPQVVIVEPPPVRYYAPPPVVYAPYNGGQLSAVPVSPVYQTAQGQYCREYQAEVIVNGRRQPGYGTACLMPDGSWRVVN